ncbi:MAG: DUF559 domain-containing protein [Myxococcales bacterium]|nr:DUF559 domain-containing protein [Myxococcales bacterium]
MTQETLCAPSVGLVVEVDGAAHRGRELDGAVRDGLLRRFGYRVLRIPADLVERDSPRPSPSSSRPSGSRSSSANRYTGTRGQCHGEPFATLAPVQATSSSRLPTPRCWATEAPGTPGRPAPCGRSAAWM